jgi:outer membrane translocation and assembly module TamA
MSPDQVSVHCLKRDSHGIFESRVESSTRVWGAFGESKMRIAIGVVFLSSIVAAMALGQGPTKQPEAAIQVRKLTLVSNDLSNGDWRPIAATLEGGTYQLEELQEQVRQKLRDSGYYFVRVENPQLTDVRQGTPARSADVSVKIEPGYQYRVGEVKFDGANAIPAERLKNRFSSAAGSLFNDSAVGEGIEKLRDLYESEGYADFSAVPAVAVNEAKRVIDVTIQIDEGKPYSFGQLTLDGNEPLPGAGKLLLVAWKDLEGKRYDPAVLKKWLAANASNWPNGVSGQAHAEGVADQEAHLMNIVMHFQ